METILKENNTYLIRLQKGEELVAKVLDFCLEEKIDSAWIEGLGACNKVEISLYDLNTRTYLKKSFEEEFEILNLTGNISLVDDKPFIHAHVTLGKSDMSVIGGHVHSIIISGTGEIKITKFDNKIVRLPDPETGLKLLHPDID